MTGELAETRSGVTHTLEPGGTLSDYMELRQPGVNDAGRCCWESMAVFTVDSSAGNHQADVSMRQTEFLKQFLKPAGDVKFGEHFPNNGRLRVTMLGLITDGIGFAVGLLRLLEENMSKDLVR